MILKHCQFYNAFNQMKKPRLSSVTNLTAESHIDTDYIITLIWYTLHIRAFHTVQWCPHSTWYCSVTPAGSPASLLDTTTVSQYDLVDDGRVYGRISTIYRYKTVQYCMQHTM